MHERKMNMFEVTVSRFPLFKDSLLFIIDYRMPEIERNFHTKVDSLQN